MNKLFVSLSFVLLALVLPAAASAGGNSPGQPAGNQLECGPEKVCEPPTEPCRTGGFEYHPHPAQENCIWPDDPCLDDPEGCVWIDDPCVAPWDGEGPPPKECPWPEKPCVTNWTEDGTVSEECFWPPHPCEIPVASDGGSVQGFPTPDPGAVPEPGDCHFPDFPDFPDDYCYFETPPGEGEGSEPGYEGSPSEPSEGDARYPGDESPVEDPSYPPGYEVGDPGELVCIYDLVPATQEKGKGKNRAEARKRALARKKAAAKRAQARRQAARKRAAAKQKRLKAKKAAQARNR